MWERNRGCWTGYVAGRGTVGGERGVCEGYHTINKPIQHSIAFLLPTVFQYWEAIRTRSALHQTTHNFISSDWNKRKGEGRLHIILAWVYYQTELFARIWERESFVRRRNLGYFCLTSGFFGEGFRWHLHKKWTLNIYYSVFAKTVYMCKCVSTYGFTTLHMRCCYVCPYVSTYTCVYARTVAPKTYIHLAYGKKSKYMLAYGIIDLDECVLRVREL